MAKKHRLIQSIYTILKRNLDGSYETKAARKHCLYQAAHDLIAGGYGLSHINGLKQKHILYLNEHWQKKGLTNATMKNRNAHLRWLIEKLNKPNMMPSNEALGIGKRRYVTNDNKAFELDDIQWDKIKDPYVKVQLHLQRYLGLRREESIKLKPLMADEGDFLMLHSSWCKGGRARRVPIATPEARYWLDEAKKLVSSPKQSLIPEGKTYIQHRQVYAKQLSRAGVKHAHGLRPSAL
jgi:site-specific recombinase XerC